MNDNDGFIYMYHIDINIERLISFTNKHKFHLKSLVYFADFVKGWYTYDVHFKGSGGKRGGDQGKKEVLSDVEG